jgi:predicted AAA+ superfamily ATPase
MELLDRMLRANPWWRGGVVPGVEGLRERDLLTDISRYVDEKQILTIVGLRRTGKTTIMRQMINRLLKKAKPEGVLYFSFDELSARNPEIIGDVLTTYENEILRGELRNVYVFLDEIQHIPDWEVILKRYYDLERGVKFVVSGSSSLHVKRSSESLAGRLYEFELDALTFKEYLRIKGIEVKDLTIQKLELRREINDYMLFGCFPELVGVEDFSKAQKYIAGIVDKIIFQDIPKNYDVDSPELMHEIFSLIAQNPGQLVEYRKYASSLDVSYQTISKYIDYMQKAFLLKMIYNFRGSPIARARKLKKAYLTAHNFVLPFVENEGDALLIAPKIVENIVLNHVKAGFFWRNQSELDFICNNQGYEVKYRLKPGGRENIGPARQLKLKNLNIVTKDYEGAEMRDGVEVKYIPLWRFLLK